MSVELSDQIYARLLAVVDAFIDTYDGAFRLRFLKALLLVEQATRFGEGLRLSEIQRLTGIPLESLRRKLQAQHRRGRLERQPDPDDERAALYRLSSAGERDWSIAELLAKLRSVGPFEGARAAGPNTLSAATYDALLSILDAILEAYVVEMRIRGYKSALLVQLASTYGQGITVSELSRLTGAPTETIRRNIARYISSGQLQIVQDPNDDRANRIRMRNPELEARRTQALVGRLGSIDWSVFDIDRSPWLSLPLNGDFRAPCTTMDQD